MADDDAERWIAVHARISALSMALGLVAGELGRRDPGAVRDIIGALAFFEAELRRENAHAALLSELRAIREGLADQDPTPGASGEPSMP